jgi:DNA mismatch repair protein MutS
LTVESAGQGASGASPAPRDPAGATPEPGAAPTALMRQYLEIKDANPDAVLFFRLGDFYEMFYEDAILVSRLLGITLTSRDKNRGPEGSVPMCGVPHHAVRSYLARMTELGYRVALCEQLEDPKTVKGIVKRGVVRIVTPGVILDEENLDPRAPNFVAAIAGESRTGFGLAFIDVTTADFRATIAPTREALMDELARADVRELVLPRGEDSLAAHIKRIYPRMAISRLSVTDTEIANPLAELSDFLSEPGQRAAFERNPELTLASARVLRYVRGTQLASPLPVHRLELFLRDDYLVIDEQARAHLELTETMLGARRDGAVLSVLDATATAMGGRLFRRWLLFPLRDVAAIRRRQDAVAALVDNQSVRDEVRRKLGELGDLERLTGRARLGVATPRDLVAIGRSLSVLPDLQHTLAGLSADLSGEHPGDAGLLRLGNSEQLEQPLGDDLVRSFADDAGNNTKDGGYIRDGVSADLDELRAIAAGGRDGISAIETRERARTGIPSLKVKFNNVFGYYIEITRSHLANVPDDYRRKQTVANAERFVTPELGEYEEKIRSADDRRVALELEVFHRLRDAVATRATALLQLAGRVAAVDVLAAMAEKAHRNGYVRPEIDDSRIIELEDSRHPVVESLSAAGGFVPNDVKLDADAEQLLLVTGPNMAGKSTLIRQVALAVVMAQMGGFVPARRARIGLCDRIFTRVGAGDNLARGESTFLVEMRETAHILRHATPRSLIVLDEIGRGTSTYDGVSIAWAVAEHVHDEVRARALFATHYHELCALGETHPRVRNVSVAAREWKGEVVFLRKLTPGGASRSFGVEVARLAGLPDGVIARAQQILRGLESLGPATGPAPVAPAAKQRAQLGLFETRLADPPNHPLPGHPELSTEVLSALVDALLKVDPDALSPRDAWAKLDEIRKKLT